MATRLARPGLALIVAMLTGCSAPTDTTSIRGEQRTHAARPIPPDAVIVHYLEIVTPEVESTCRALEAMHGVRFGEAVAALGNARTLQLPDGRRIGIRAPMHDGERPVVRPYLLVKDIAAAVEAARAAGAEIASIAQPSAVYTALFERCLNSELNAILAERAQPSTHCSETQQT